ncbi:MAG: DNA topoisomerase IB [Actinobacteria bacterium]|nr:DNA topoisomerase IB [Actinomycetota bacterium]
MTGEATTVTRAMRVLDTLGEADADEHAEAIGLSFVTEQGPGLTRVRRGRGFSYHRPDGELIQGEQRRRIEELAIPPAWSDVWICDDPNGHLQATGRDAAGRKQYLYHPVWRTLREAAKFHRLADVGAALPRLRRTVDGHLRKHDLTREKVLALVVALLDETLMRIGNEQYARDGGARGLTTLETSHVRATSSRVSFSFPGKAGQDREVDLRHPRLARHVLRIQDAPGQRVFAYRTDDGGWQEVRSDDVNRYLREIAGDDITAKDFRTWGGTVVAAERLRTRGPPASAREADANVIAAVDAVAEQLGNTRAVARASYVHPVVPKAYRFDRFEECFRGGRVPEHLSRSEQAVRRMLALDLPASDDLEAQLEESLERASPGRSG